MIDCGSTWNLISQHLVQENGIPGDDDVPPGLKTLDGNPLRIYQNHPVDVWVTDSNGEDSTVNQPVLGVDMKGSIQMILGLPWLHAASPLIYWKSSTFSFRDGSDPNIPPQYPVDPNKPEIGEYQLKAMRSNPTGLSHGAQEEVAKQTGRKPVEHPEPRELPDRSSRLRTVPEVRSESENSSDRSRADTATVPDIALVSEVEFGELCASEGLQAYVIEWRDLQDPLSGWGSAEVVAAVRAESDEGPVKQVVLPEKYSDFSDVFDKAKADKLPEPSRHDLAIELIDDRQPPFGPIYNLSRTELEVMREYVNEMLAKGFIQPSKSPSGAPVLFVPKKDGGLRLCVDYRGLNKITIKNKHPLPLIQTLLDLLMGAWFFTKFDIISAYHALRIRAGDEWKTAFRCRYGHFEYRVVPFGLVNAPAAFQAYINLALREFLDFFVIAYLDDLVIYSKKHEDHTEHVRKVLEKLRQYGLYVKLSKCVFDSSEIEFLGFIVNRLGVAMDPVKLGSVATWPLPKSFRDVQVFLGFANFYRRFIDKFSRVASGLSDLLKGSQKGKFKGMKFNLTQAAIESFHELKRRFTTAPMLRHYDPDKRLQLETDASGFAISGILSQLWESTGQWHPIAFWSRKQAKAELNYGAGEGELLAVVEACKQWRHYLEGAAHRIRVITDHCNLRTFLTTKNLSRREARWWEKLSGLDLEIEYRPGKHNPADGPSRRPDYMDNEPMHTVGYVTRSSTKAQGKGESQVPPEPRVTNGSDYDSESPLVTHPRGISHSATNSDAELDVMPSRRRNSEDTPEHAKTLEQSEESAKPVRLHLMGEDDREAQVNRETIKKISAEDSVFGAPSLEFRTVLKVLQESDQLAQEERSRIVMASTTPQEAESNRTQNGSVKPDNNKKKSTNSWHISDELLCYENRWYLPPGLLRREILRLHHDDPFAGHFAFDRTLDLVRRKYYWPEMINEVREYVEACVNCKRIKAARHLPYGELQSLPFPKGPRQEWTMDFITDLPPSMLRGVAYDSILVIVDCYSKYAIYLPARKDWKAKTFADLVVERVFTQFGMPVSIVSDRGSLFTSEFWSQFCYYLWVRLGYSTAFHPQTDGQTERQNQTLEQYLRSYVGYLQDDWIFWLPVAQFAYNNSLHSTLGESPFQCMFAEPARWEDVIRNDKDTEVPEARKRAIDLAAMRGKLEARVKKAVEQQAKYYNAKHKPQSYKVGDMVYLNSKNIKSTRPSKKLDYKYYGPYEVELPIGKQAYRLRLPPSMKIHNVFHVSLLEPCNVRPGSALPPPPPIIVNEGEEEYEVEEILDSRLHYGKLQYLVKWLGYPQSENQWLGADNVAGSTELIDLFHRLFPQKPDSKSKPEKRKRGGENPSSRKRRKR